MDTLTAMKSFVRVVEMGSFSMAADEQNTTQAAISKRVAALESMLSTQLLIRNNKLHTLTEAGEKYYARAVNILQDINEAEIEAKSLTATPKGKLKVTIPSQFGHLYLASIVPKFLAEFPDIQLDLRFSESMLNLLEEGIDVAIRLGDLKDSSLIAKPLGTDKLILVASPEYLKTHTTPQHPKALSKHNSLIYRLASQGGTIWQFSQPKPKTSVRVTGNFQCDTGSGLMEMLLADAGIAFMPTWLVKPYITSGRLVHILPDYYYQYPINAVYPQNRYIPLKVKCFLNFMEQEMRSNLSIIS